MIEAIEAAKTDVNDPEMSPRSNNTRGSTTKGYGKNTTSISMLGVGLEPEMICLLVPGFRFAKTRQDIGFGLMNY